MLLGVESTVRHPAKDLGGRLRLQSCEQVQRRQSGARVVSQRSESPDRPCRPGVCDGPSAPASLAGGGEIMRRFRFIEVVGRPVRVKSCFVRGFSHLPVCVYPW